MQDGARVMRSLPVIYLQSHRSEPRSDTTNCKNTYVLEELQSTRTWKQLLQTNPRPKNEVHLRPIRASLPHPLLLSPLGRKLSPHSPFTRTWVVLKVVLTRTLVLLCFSSPKRRSGSPTSRFCRAVSRVHARTSVVLVRTNVRCALLLLSPPQLRSS